MNKSFTYFMRITVPLLIMLFAATSAWATTDHVSYIDVNGNTQYVTATVLTGSEGYLGSNGATTWYVVNSDINRNGSISCYGNVNILLPDGTRYDATGKKVR